jgi:uncharacterized protein (TIGR02421 family)
MTMKDKEGLTIRALSKRLIDAQRKIHILDHIKWDDSIKERFFTNKAKEMPLVDEEYYKNHPLPFDVKEKIHEFRHIIRDTQNQLGEYSAITRLIKRQCEEYILSVRMLEGRGTPVFTELSAELYGSSDDVFYPSGPKLSEMGVLLFDILTSLNVQLETEADVCRHTAEEAKDLLQKRMDEFFTDHPVKVVVHEDMVADAAAGAESITLSKDAKFSDREIRYLEVHEGWVHVGTTLNGLLQPYCTFLSKGTPSCSVIQEGLAVLTEIVAFASSPIRLRKLTNRVIGIDKVTQGANFLELYNYYVSCGLTEDDSYNRTVRVFRGSTPTGGPFTKDLSYAKGLVLIYTFIQFAITEKRIDIVPLLFSGKIMLDDLPLLLELKSENLITDPIYLPPQFRDLSALSVWMSLSLYINKFDLSTIDHNLRFLLV